MAHDESSAGLLRHATDTHLAERARLGDAVAFGELYRRHATTVGRYAVTLTGDPTAAHPVVARAFADLCDAMTSGDYAVDDPYLSGLLRSARGIALAPADVHFDGADHGLPPVPLAGTEEFDAEVLERFWALPEIQRATRYLTGTLGLATDEVALALDRPVDEVAMLDATSLAAMADRPESAHVMLACIDPGLSPDTDEAARTTWREWVATVGIEPTGAVHRLAHESLTSRILRGAAVLLLVMGGAGLLTNGSITDAATDQAASAAESGEPGRGATGTDGARGPSVAPHRIHDGPAETGTTPSGLPLGTRPSGTPLLGGGTSPGALGPGAKPGSAIGSARGATPVAGSTTGPAVTGPTRPGAPIGGGSTPGAPPVTPSAPSAPSSPSAPPNPSTPAPPTPAPTTPATPPPGPVTPPAPPAPSPAPPSSPPATPPAPAPAPPSNPVTDLVNVVTGTLGTVTGGLGLGGLGGK